MRTLILAFLAAIFFAAPAFAGGYYMLGIPYSVAGPGPYSLGYLLPVGPPLVYHQRRNIAPVIVERGTIVIHRRVVICRRIVVPHDGRPPFEMPCD